MSLSDNLVERAQIRRFLEEKLTAIVKDPKNSTRLLLVLGKGGSGRSGIQQLAHDIAEKQGHFGIYHFKWSQPYAVSHQFLYDVLCPSTSSPLFSYLAEYRHLNELLPELEQRVEREQLKLAWPTLDFDPTQWPQTATDNTKQADLLYRTVQALPPKALHYLIRRLYNVYTAAQLSEQAAAFIKTGLEHIIQLTATNLSQLLEFVEEKIKPMFTDHEFELYLHPQDTLAKALGLGLADAAETQPLFISIDNYRNETSDRLLRGVIEVSGKCFWLLIAKERPAWSEKLSGVAELQPPPISIQGAVEYFQATYKREIQEPVVETLVRITKGAPLALLLAIDLFAKGARLADIEQAVALTPTDALAGLLQYLVESSKRFSKVELARLYMLAILRNNEPDDFLQAFEAQVHEAEFEFDAKTVEALVQKCPALFETNAGDSKAHLHPAVRNALRRYLLVERHRFSRPVQEGILEPARTVAVRRLVALEEQLVTASTGGSLYERANNGAWGEAVMDVAYYRMWLDEAIGWNFLLPRWLMAYVYNPSLAQQMLEAILSLESTFYTEGAELLPILRSLLAPSYGTGSKNLEEKLKSLEVLDNLSTSERGRWYRAENLGKAPVNAGNPEAELRGIVRWLQARVYEEAGQYDRAASIYEGVLATNVKMPQMEKEAAKAALYLSVRYLLKGGQENTFSAVSRAAELDPSFYEAQAAAFYQSVKLGRFEAALRAADNLATLGNSYGDLYSSFCLLALNRTEEALTEARTYLTQHDNPESLAVFEALRNFVDPKIIVGVDFQPVIEILAAK